LAAHPEEGNGTLLCRGTPVEKHCTRRTGRTGSAAVIYYIANSREN